MMRPALVLTVLLLVIVAVPRPGPAAEPGVAGPGDIDTARLARIDELVTAAIRDKKTPGGVVLVWHGGRTVYQKAYGNRALVPDVEAMTLDTIFDLASLTKVVATTTGVMILVEEGRLRLTDRVATFIPEFARYGKKDITIRHLLTHVSGLRPDIDLGDVWQGSDTAIARAVEEVPAAPPDTTFVYSDINFFLLGEIIARVSGMPLDRFSLTRIFEPLGMRDTMFRPPGDRRERIAPTEACSPLAWPCDASAPYMLRGVAHDPTARRMGGVAGHAGLFSTTADLALFCRMILGGGAVGGRRILSPLSIAKMTTAATSPSLGVVWGLGWDIDSAYSANRGELLPIGSFGHTGFTGTSIWIDPRTDTFIIFLSNRLHPDGRGDVTSLRAMISTVVASALLLPPDDRWQDARYTSPALAPSGGLSARPSPMVLSGLDVLRVGGFAPLRGKRVGLLTNRAGQARDGKSAIDLLHRSKDVSLVALFSPEHSIRSDVDAPVPSTVDEKTGLPVYSLYGDTRRPLPSQLEGIDVLVIDLPDVGTRFYTYMTTMAYAMEEAARHGVEVMVLDRPNPIGGMIEGPLPDAPALGFTAYYPMPTRHGMTIGELARLFNAERRIGATLSVVEMRGWRRDLWFDETGLPWTNPSPNMRSVTQAVLYPGLGSIEQTNVSVGRGTDAPFEQVGAPWIDGVQLAAELNGRGLPGIRSYPVEFTPTSGKYSGETCGGVFIIVTNRTAVRPVRMGLEIAAALYRLYESRFDIDAAIKLFGSSGDLARAKAGEDVGRITDGWAAGEATWRLLRSQYLLYD